MENKPTSSELTELFHADQVDRSGAFDEVDREKMIANDKARLLRAKEIYTELKRGVLEFSARDLYHLAMIFQHSSVPEDHAIALELATRSGEKGDKEGKWLSAAAEDRYLLNIGKKQKWGTQFKKGAVGDEWELSPMETDEESGVTDEMRKERGVPARAEQMKTFLERTDI